MLFEGIFPKNVNLDRHEYALRNISAYFVPRHNNIFFKRFPPISFPSTWNEIPADLKLIESKQLIKHKLKEMLLENISNFECNKLYCYVCSNCNIYVKFFAGFLN